jgi:ribosome recycling factor
MLAMNINDLQGEKEKILEWLRNEYKAIQTGRATPAVLDGIVIEQYGTRTPIAHAASISIEDPRTLRVAPWDKAIIRDIEKAINEADIGLSVSSDEQGLRVSFPMLTTETRQKLTKVLKDRLEEARVRVRGVREDANKDIDARGKDGEFGDDERIRLREQVQAVVDTTNAELEAIFEKKEKEVMGE